MFILYLNDLKAYVICHLYTIRFLYENFSLNNYVINICKRSNLAD